MEYDGHGSPVRGGNNNNSAESSEDTPNGAANSSIISKVRSRVSNILPNRLTEWFSPSVKTPTDSLNGNFSGTGITRRRRRIEVDDDDDDDEDEEADEEEDGDEEDIDDNNIANDDDDDDEEEEEEDGNRDVENVRRRHRDNENSEEEDESNVYNRIERAARARLGVRRHLRATNVTVARQPAAKRLRIDPDITSQSDSPLVPRLPLVASTPAMGNNSISSQRGVAASTPSRYLNLYGELHGRREPPYNFLPPSAANESRAVDVNELVLPIQGAENSSRRRLNIPSLLEHTNSGSSSSHGLALKRQPLSSMRGELSPGSGVSTRRMPTTIFEQQSGDEDEANHDDDRNDEDDALSTNNNNYGNTEMLSKTQNIAINYNGDMTASNRARLVNGTRWDGTENVRDSASDSSDCVADLLLMGDGTGADMTEQSAMLASTHRRTGLFNVLSSRATNTSSRNGSRTSSFGNGLNFHTHLEGRKSLFAGGGQHGIGATLGAGGGALNNSTLSLTSLNRRQFNASLYGSTSALSDSRLLNTFSPFYKGKTMYGGAAAYSSRGTDPTAGTGAGASGALRITSTQIRPTSSISTLSSSSNSLAPLGAGPGVENASTISCTTKRILDLINDFATPLSEAKKMANNVKANQKQFPQTRSRLCDADVQAARAVRLSQVRTPYMRSTVILHPTKASTTQLPPVRELQVPTISQLVQIKKLQGSTEFARQTAAAQNNASLEYTLPVATSADASVSEQQSAQLQKHHTNKIKHKLSSAMRATSTRDGAIDEIAPPPPNLQNIAFPLMSSVPQIDIALPMVTASNSFAAPPANVAALPFAATTAFSKIGASAAALETPVGANNISNSSHIINFTFSKPLEFPGVSTPKCAISPSGTANYHFNPPTKLASPSAAVVSAPTVAKQLQPEPQHSTPSLKSGSVLDALRQPFVLPAQSQQTQAAITSTTTTSKPFDSSFGDQFKKSAGEWECDECMVRNKNEATKCVACLMSRKSAAPSASPSASLSASPSASPSVAVTATAATSTVPLSSHFGNQFMKAAGEWECDTCMLRNKNDAKKCVACETPHKQTSLTSAATAPCFSVNTMVVDPFKPQATGSTWECPTCLIRNKLEVAKCAACQTQRPEADNGATKTTTTGSIFKFGFPASATSRMRSAAATVEDATFKKLAAAQMSAKWECEACMTRNDAARSKCVCCEQAKPGSHAAASDAADNSVPKFAFGSTAAAKFTFGFVGTAADKEGAKTEASDASKTVNFVFGASSGSASDTSTQPETAIGTAAPSASDFTFGFKPTSTATPSCAADSGAIAGPTASPTTTTTTTSQSTRSEVQFKFGASTANSDASKTMSSGFTFGAAPSATTTITNSTISSDSETATVTASSTFAPAAVDTAIDTPSVKFNLPTTNAATTTASAVTALTTTPATTSSFSFGSSSKTAATDATVTAADPAQPQSSFSFASASPKRVSVTSAPSLGGFAFKSTATASIGVVEPMFSCGSPITTITTTSAMATTKEAAAVATTAAMSMPTFSFGSNVTNSSGGIGSVTVSKSVFNTTAPSLFANETATTTAATSTNVFGSFASGGVANSAIATAAPSATVFGSSAAGSNKNNIESSISTNVTPTPTFGSFGAAPSASSTGSSSMFGAFGANTKPTAAATPLFGNSSNNSTNISSNSGAVASTTSSFVFGSSTGTAVAPVSAPQAMPTNAANTAWGKNSFVFGGASSTLGAPSGPSEVGGLVKSASSLFGAAAQSTPGSATVAPAAPMFGNLGTNTSALAFGSTSGTAGNLFGSATAATTPAAPPAFGSAATLFIGSGGGAATLPAFGSVAAAVRPPPLAFGSDGNGAGLSANINNIARGSTTTDGASLAKKPALSFSFGGGGGSAGCAADPTQSTGGIFNFGSAVGAKPSFNFSSTTAQVPAFNFTGNAETQAAQQMMHQQPFQFGAIASMPAPIFNFTSSHVEPTQNAQFQFGSNGGGAGSIPANIFAPTVTPGAAGAQHQVRRKIRTPMRRLTPR